MTTHEHIVYDLALQGLAMVARGMDLRSDRAWRALMEVANCIAEKYPGSDPVSAMLIVEKESKAWK